ncbi:hypothetical protein ACFXDH_26010 [Streptomyces sp. NPDC059467]|uniref:hypothetical protein n=1 Tax=Streptomyces sp. NPDC059467 TaxID=3346844 RepID=UPI00369A7C7C
MLTPLATDHDAARRRRPQPGAACRASAAHGIRVRPPVSAHWPALGTGVPDGGAGARQEGFHRCRPGHWHRSSGHAPVRRR